MAGPRRPRSTRAWSRPATCSSGSPVAPPTAASTPPPRSLPGPGAWSSSPAAPRSSTGRRLGIRRRRSAGRPAVARPRLAARARLPGRRDHRLDRQDLGQGHHAGAAARAGPREPGELQHRDRPAADDPLGAARDRDAGARDGDARRRPDRRALCDRRARRRRDHQRRPGSPRAAGHARGDRRGEGRDPRRASTTTGAL